MMAESMVLMKLMPGGLLSHVEVGASDQGSDRLDGQRPHKVERAG